MNEEQKIDKVLEEYKSFFETTTADVTKLSLKGRRFFFLTDRKCGDLYGLAEFSSAEGLEKLILTEMVDQITMRLEMITENVSSEVKHLDVSYSAFDFNETISELKILLDVIQKEFCKYLPEIITSLKGISTYIDKHEDTQK